MEKILLIRVTLRAAASRVSFESRGFLRLPRAATPSGSSPAGHGHLCPIPGGGVVPSQRRCVLSRWRRLLRSRGRGSNGTAGDRRSLPRSFPSSFAAGERGSPANERGQPRSVRRSESLGTQAPALAAGAAADPAQRTPRPAAPSSPAKPAASRTPSPQLRGPVAPPPPANPTAAHTTRLSSAPTPPRPLFLRSLLEFASFAFVLLSRCVTQTVR